MKVAVLGSKGLIGRAVVRLLEERGDEVETFDQDKGNLALDSHAEYAVQNVGAVVHLAGRRASVASQKVKGFDLLSENLAVDLAVFRAARKADIKKLVYTSTVSVYPEWEWKGDCRPNIPYEEAHACTFPDASVRFSAWGKLTAELLIEASGLPWSVVRLVNTYGPNDNFGTDALVIPALIQRALAGEDPLGVAGWQNERDFLYVDDAATGIVAALDRPGIYNLGTGVGVKIGDLARLILKVCNASCKLEYLEGGSTGVCRKVVNPTKAFRELGWKAQIPLIEGIQRTVDWRRACPESQ